MLVATVARLALSLATFVVLVRYLGPTNFGYYAAFIALAAVLSAVTDFGLVTRTMRAASMDREHSGQIVGDALALKLVFVTIALLAVAGLGLLFVTGMQWLTLVLLHIGMFAYSFADLSMVAARVNRRFPLEAKIVVSSALAMFGIVASVAALTQSLPAVAAAFAATRLGYVAAVRFGLRGLLEPVAAFGRSFTTLARTAKASAAYAVDSTLTMISNQFDVLVFSLVLTVTELGIYQSGARLTQLIVPFAVMLSSVYLPALSASLTGSDAERDFRKLSGRLTAEFTVLAIAGSFAFLIGGPIVTEYVYGPEFAALDNLWPAFALYALFRFAAAGYGIQLVALGRITPRIVSQMAGMLVLAALAFAWLPSQGFNSSSTVMAAMGITGYVILGISLIRAQMRHWLMPVSFLVIPLAAVLLFWLSR